MQLDKLPVRLTVVETAASTQPTQRCGFAGGLPPHLLWVPVLHLWDHVGSSARGTTEGLASSV